MASTPDFPAKFDLPVPRYTSYPTALQFHGGIGQETYRDWLGQLAPAAPVSLYLHVPTAASSAGIAAAIPMSPRATGRSPTIATCSWRRSTASPRLCRHGRRQIGSIGAAEPRRSSRRGISGRCRTGSADASTSARMPRSPSRSTRGSSMRHDRGAEPKRGQSGQPGRAGFRSRGSARRQPVAALRGDAACRGRAPRDRNRRDQSRSHLWPALSNRGQRVGDDRAGHALGPQRIALFGYAHVP